VGENAVGVGGRRVRRILVTLGHSKGSGVGAKCDVSGETTMTWFDELMTFFALRRPAQAPGAGALPRNHFLIITSKGVGGRRSLHPSEETFAAPRRAPPPARPPAHAPPPHERSHGPLLHPLLWKGRGQWDCAGGREPEGSGGDSGTGSPASAPTPPTQQQQKQQQQQPREQQQQQQHHQ
jgi:hypothetical protein